ncbi:alpha-mannosidase [Streptomyces sp. 8L]|uniref:alpha-mannosidase n=1 Tax=Streptomyces sp. 8L TaxID=2877242 RepID=UPI001CD5FC57|nr:glycoside hydrolase family 38 C-terminal domain-containing protein [Streptomyces sp. 8L]MCA1217290.1 glycosyl hydrolase-related protein [Streptomyces sp. 8L]
MLDRISSGEARISHFLADRLRHALRPERLPLDIGAWHIAGEPVPVGTALRASYAPFAPGGRWGAPWSTTWFSLAAEIPARWAGRRVDAVLDLGDGAEGLVHDERGTPLTGLRSGEDTVNVTAAAGGGERVRLLVEAAATPRIDAATGAGSRYGSPVTVGNDPLHRLVRADLVVRNEDVWHLLHDVDVLDGLMRALPPELPRRHEILRALEDAVDAVDPRDVPGTAAVARSLLAPVLARGAYASAHTVAAVGHPAPNRGLLWPHRESVRKAARDFSGLATLAEEYPELVVAAGAPHHHAWMKDTHPHVFERIRKAVAYGNWVPAGGMWAEPDGVLPGGESLARQLVLGMRFCREELGAETDGVWFGGASGISPALPQLAALAGARWLLARQPPGGAEAGLPPHHTFWWEGLDGTRVFTHVPPLPPGVDGSDSSLTGGELAAAVAAFADKGDTTASLAPFGGDGGPTPSMLERTRRLADLEGSPRVVLQHPARFFRDALREYGECDTRGAQEAHGAAAPGHGAPGSGRADGPGERPARGAPVLRGELFPGTHPGTYTGQARTKRGNRRAESLLREAELWSATAAVFDHVPYPYEELEALWREVLRLQSAPVLGGTSIAWVHEEAELAHDRVHRALERLIGRATAGPGARPAVAGAAVFNAGPLSRREVVVVDERLDTAVHARSGGGQTLSDGRIAVLAEAPALGAGRVVTPLDEPALVHVAEEPDGSVVLDNGLLRVAVDGRGLVRSAVESAGGRDAIAPGGAGNLLQLWRDDPPRWGAHERDGRCGAPPCDLGRAGPVEVVERGPLLAAVRVVHTTGASTVEQRLSLAAGARALTVETEADWRERDTVLTCGWELDVRAQHTTGEIQFGHTAHPTRPAGAAPGAGVERWAHRWLHAGEHDWGVAFAGDCGYGYDASCRTRGDGGTTTTVRLTLLRSARTPDPHADRGPQRFRHTVRPGASVADALGEGYAVNLPLRPGPDPGWPPLVAVSGEDVVVEAVKLADDRRGDVVVRLYEARGGRARTTLTAAFPVARAEVTDLLERPCGELPLRENAVELSLRPFEIRTLRLVRADEPAGQRRAENDRAGNGGTGTGDA